MDDIKKLKTVSEALKSGLIEFWARFWHGKGTIEELWAPPEEVMKEPHVIEELEYLNKHLHSRQNKAKRPLE